MSKVGNVSGEGNKLKKQLELLSEHVNMDIYEQRKHLLGRILTVLDAITTDPQQRKATKDLIEGIFYNGSYWNGIRHEFREIARANGFEILPDIALTDNHAPMPVNRYEQI